MKAWLLTLLTIGIFVLFISLYMCCIALLRDYKYIINLLNNDLTTNTSRINIRITPIENIELPQLPDLPIPQVEGVKIEQEIERLPVIQVN